MSSSIVCFMGDKPGKQDEMQDGYLGRQPDTMVARCVDLGM